MTIIEFLEARITEDEAAVKLRADPHAVHLSDVFGSFNAGCPDCRGLPGSERTMAECKAKRAVIEHHGPGDNWYGDYCETCAEWWASEIGEGPPGVKFPCPTLRALAAVYKDHPDYRQEWAIGG